MEIETSVAPLTVDDGSFGSLGAAHRDRLAPKVNVPVAVAGVSVGSYLYNVTIPGSIDRSLDRGIVSRNTNGGGIFRQIDTEIINQHIGPQKSNIIRASYRLDPNIMGSRGQFPGRGPVDPVGRVGIKQVT